MIELPTIDGIRQHAICLSCKGRSLIDGKYYCDESKLKQQPYLCPRPKINNKADKTVDAYAMLRKKLGK